MIPTANLEVIYLKNTGNKNEKTNFNDSFINYRNTIVTLIEVDHLK